MPDISITDDVGKPVAGATVDLTSPSSLFNYLKSQVFHLIVVPENLVAQEDCEAEPAQPQGRIESSAEFYPVGSGANDVGGDACSSAGGYSTRLNGRYRAAKK